MNYLLDSNIISDFYSVDSVNSQSIHRLFAKLNSKDKIFISILSIYEFEFALANAPDMKKLPLQSTIALMQQNFSVLPLTIQSAPLFGKIKKSIKDLKGLNKENLKKHNIDLMLAASAISESCILVSADKIYQDIQQIYPNLQLENWVTF